MTGDATGPLDLLFGALADPTRRRLLERLVREGPASATALSVGATTTRQAVLKHLKALEAAGLVTAERSGREVLFRSTPEPLADVVVWLVGHGAAWDKRLARLRDTTVARVGP